MNIGLALKGAAMGVAEAIPGVSGGTIAFITGIYQELLETIKGITPATLRLILTDRKAFWQAINGKFLLWLLLGMGAGLVTGILVISHLLENHQILLWGFFFGLVIASAAYLAKDVKWSLISIIGAVIGGVFAYFITNLAPSAGSENPLYLFLSGCLAISALMLPGVSGSFVLLLLGLYDQIINGLKAIITDQDFSQLMPIGIFAAGAFVGLFSFARMLSYLFKKYPNNTMATMIGVLIGSLGKLWPWKKITSVYNKVTGETSALEAVKLPDNETFKILSETNLLPQQFATYDDPRTLVACFCLFAGIAVVYMLSKVAKQG